MAGIFVNSGSLLAIAKEAYERARHCVKDARCWQSNEPLISIVFAAAAAEAFINELGELASQTSELPAELVSEPAQVENLARLLSEAEAARVTTNLKYLLAKVALTGLAFDKGSNPYQDFDVLMNLRNSLMHIKFDRIESVRINEVSVAHPPVIAKLRSRNVLAQFEDDENTIASWVLRISTPAVAEWACNATAGIVKDIVESIPTSELRRTADLFYGRSSAFAAVPK